MAVLEQSQERITVNLAGVRFSPDVCPAGFPFLTQELVEDIVRRIVVGLHPHAVILFGSYSKNNSSPKGPTPDSDLDLLVIMDSNDRPVERVLVVSRLLRPRPFPMDILVRSRSEINKLLEEGDSFFSGIMKQGVVIYEQPA